ncbi:MAG: DUF3519 domain-containing protein, partial [Campylobacter sp.]|nr:DUF3519 domain-containing protein [Campylobacter sp.]
GEDSKQAKDIKEAQKILEASRDAYKANNPDKWNIAGFAGEMITDPLNAVGLAKGFKIANTAFKKGANVAFDLAQLGAIGGIAGAISEYGSYKEKDEQNISGAAMMGAASGVVLGAGFMALGAVLGKIASRFGDKSTLEKNAQMAKDETLKTMEQTGTPKDTDERLKKISDDIEEAFGADENGQNIARLLGQEYDIHINEAIKQSEEATTAIDSSVAEFASANPNASASDIEIYINKTYAPSQNEKELTRIINDDKPVTPRMAGYRVLGVLQKTMEYKRRFDRDTVVKRFKNHGFSDELANVFAEAYIADDISVARRYLDSKVASNREKSVDEGRNEWLEITTKDKQAANATKEPKQDQEQIYNDITSKDMPFHLIDDMDMTPQLQSRLEKDGYTLERESQSGVWEVSRSISNQEIKSADMENSDNLFKKIRDASKKVLSTFLGKTSKNNIDGREVKFTKRSLDKMTSGSAVGKSLDNGFTREEHYEAAQNILEIFKTAKFVETQPPKNGSLDILGVHKYMGEYKNANVKITIKEIKEHGNTFYSIELMELLSRDMQSGDPKTGNLDNTAIIHTDEEPPRPRTSSPYNANSKTIPNQSIKEAENLTQYRKDIEAKYNIRPIKEFGTNYAEFYHDGKGAINKLLVEKQGQVAGAFEREGLGDIDLVWGEFEVVKGDIKGYGLSKIEAKHLNDFAIFEGNTPQEKMANGIAEIIEKGEIKIDNNSRTTIVYNKNDKVYKIGLKQNWKGNPTENKWIVTAYDDIREANKIINSKGFTKGETLPLNSSGNSTTTAIKSQELNLSRAERRAMGIEEPKGKTLVIDEKAVKNDVREFGRLAHQVGLGFKSAKEAKAVMDKCDKSKFDCGS